MRTLLPLLYFGSQIDEALSDQRGFMCDSLLPIPVGRLQSVGFFLVIIGMLALVTVLTVMVSGF